MKHWQPSYSMTPPPAETDTEWKVTENTPLAQLEGVLINAFEEHTEDYQQLPQEVWDSVAELVRRARN